MADAGSPAGAGIDLWVASEAPLQVRFPRRRGDRPAAFRKRRWKGLVPPQARG